jgi:hypothetical protein
MAEPESRQRGSTSPFSVVSSTIRSAYEVRDVCWPTLGERTYNGCSALPFWGEA